MNQEQLADYITAINHNKDVISAVEHRGIIGVLHYGDSDRTQWGASALINGERITVDVNLAEYKGNNAFDIIQAAWNKAVNELGYYGC